MDEAILTSNRDTLLVAIPFVAMLLMSYFRLDELIVAPDKAGKPRRAPCGVDMDGEPILCDPDGRPSGNARTTSH